MDLKNKVVVVTGASKGLGKQLAIEFIKNGCIVVVSSRDLNELEQTAKEIEATPIVCDVRKQDQVEELAKKTVEKLGSINVWVNNAGVWIPRLNAEETDWNRAHDMMEVNLFGTVYGSLAALKQMKKQESGCVINVLSTTALESKAGRSAYAATKFAAKAFTDAFREENPNLLVVSAFPGGMKTNLFDEQKPDDYKDFMDASVVAKKIVENLKKEKPDEQQVFRRN